MRLLLDARKIEDYGIGVYIRHVFGGLLEQPFFEDIRVIHLAGKERLAVPRQKEIRAHYANYDPREQLEIPWKCRHLKGYYYFSPHYIFPLFLRQRLIVTVHDLIHFKFPAFFKPQVKVEIARFFLRQIKSRAALVFTVSRQTAADLAEMFSIPMDKIRIIYNGVADTFFQTPPFASPYLFPYIIYVGNWKPHKNIITLLQAFRFISTLHPDLRLVLIGLAPRPAVQKEISRLNLNEKCLLLGYLPQPEVIRYLDGACLFVFPSLYEGFGLPPLEAMARGRAVISSPAGSLREVLADAALYFDPTSAEDLAAKIDLLLSDESKRHSYEKKGRQRSSLFRWPEAVARHVHFLQDLE